MPIEHYIKELDDLEDVNLAGLANGDTIIYNGTTHKFEPGSGGGGGGSSPVQYVGTVFTTTVGPSSDTVIVPNNAAVITPADQTAIAVGDDGVVGLAPGVYTVDVSLSIVYLAGAGYPTAGFYILPSNIAACDKAKWCKSVIDQQNTVGLDNEIYSTSATFVVDEADTLPNITIHATNSDSVNSLNVGRNNSCIIITKIG